MNTTFITGILSIAGLIVAAPVLGAWAQEDSMAMEDAMMADAMMSVTGTVQIGGLFPLSGELASIGTELRVAADLAVDDFNVYLAEQGAGWQVEMVVEDTGTNPTQALEKLQSLYARGISLVAGPATSGNLGHISGYANLNDILLVSASSTAPNLAIPGDNIYRLAPDDNNQGVAMGTVLDLDGVTGIVPMWRGDSYGDGLRDVTVTTFKEYGGEVHPGVRYAPQSPNFGLEAALLNKYVEEMVQEHGIENVAVYLISFEEGERIIESAQVYGLLKQVRWYGGEALAQAKYLVGDTAVSEFATLTDFTAMDVTPGDKAGVVSEHILATTGSFQTAFVYPQYDTIWVLGKAIMKAQSTEIEAVKAVLPDVAADYTGGALSSTRLNADGDLDLANYQVWEVSDNTWTKRGIFASERTLLTATEQPEGDVSVGSLYPLTGVSTKGSENLAATQLGAADFNAFLNSLNIGWQLVVVPEDSTDILEKAQAFSADDIDIIIGPEISDNVKRIKPFIDINDMVLVSCCSTSTELAEPDDGVFRLAPDDSKQGVAMGTLLENEGIKALVTIWRNDTYGQSLNNSTVSNFESRGGIVGGSISYSTDTMDFANEVGLLADAVQDLVDEHGADSVAVLVIANDESVNIAFTAISHESDILDDIRWFGSDSLTGAPIVYDATLADFGNTVRFTSMQPAVNPGSAYERVHSHIAEQFDKDPASTVYRAYDAAWLVGLSILQTGMPDALSVRDTLNTVAASYHGALDNLMLNESGDLAAASYEIWQVADGAWIEIGIYDPLDNSVTINYMQ